MKISKDKLQKAIVKNTLLSEGLKYHLDHSIPLHDNIYRPGSERFFSLICEARKWYNQGYLSILKDDLDIINSDMGLWETYMGREVALDYPISQETDMMMQTLDAGHTYSHQVLSRVFNNEFGNEIEVEVRDAVPDDFLPHEKPYQGVFLKLAGPTSETGNVMTKKEAQALLGLLHDYFCNAEYCELYEGKKKKRKSRKKKKSGTRYRGRKVKLNKPKRGGKKKFYVYVRDPDTKNIRRVEFGQRGMETGLRDPARRKSFKNRHNCTEKKDKTKPGYWACRIGRHPKVTGAPYTTWW